MIEASVTYAAKSGTFERADFQAELGKLEAALADETLKRAYDESYIERKKEALERAGIAHE
jgi:hypothetical protein